ncbi:MAG: hypothetical protein ABEJ40_05225, partial [Haloarculaceae archaeon]
MTSDSLWVRLERKLPDRIRKKYLRKFLAVAVFVAVLVLLLGVYTQLTVSAELTENRNDQLTSSAELSADNVERWI